VSVVRVPMMPTNRKPIVPFFEGGRNITEEIDSPGAAL